MLVNSDDRGEQATVRIEVHPQAAEVFEWLGTREEIFTLNEMQERFPAFPLDQHIVIAQNCAKARLLQLMWFPDV